MRINVCGPALSRRDIDDIRRGCEALVEEEEDVEANFKRLGIVVDDRVDACLRFKS